VLSRIVQMRDEDFVRPLFLPYAACYIIACVVSFYALYSRSVNHC
jgi:uncharacterized membrane protein